MKKRKGIFFGFIALFAMMFAFVGCDNSTNVTRVAWEDMPDDYTHASYHWAIGAPIPGAGPINSKAILSGDAYDRALQFLVRSSHYLFLERNMWMGGAGPFHHPLSDPYWRSAINGRPYAFPNANPAATLKRYAVILSINPNGSINASLGAYWGIAMPDNDLSDVEVTNAHGWTPSTNPQAFMYFGISQTTTNIRDRQRATIVVDARGLGDFAVPPEELAAGQVDLRRVRYIFMEVRLRSQVRRTINFPDFFAGLVPGGAALSFRSMLNNEIQFPLMTHAAFHALSAAEQAEYLASIPAEAQVIANRFGTDFQWFDIMQLVAVSENLRLFDGQTATGAPGPGWDWNP